MSLRRTKTPLCVVCMDRQRNVLLSCGHSNICAHCLEQLPSQVCPTCRKSIKNVELTPLRSSYQRNINLLPSSITPSPRATTDLTNDSTSPTSPSPRNIQRSHSTVLSRTTTIAPPQPPRQKTVLFIASPSVPLSSLLQNLLKTYPSTRSPFQQHHSRNHMEINVNNRHIRLAPYIDKDERDIVQVIRRVRPKLIIMCASKSKITTFERVLRTDLELLQQRSNRGNGHMRLPPRIWVILDKERTIAISRGGGRGKSHGVERGDLKAAWHYLGEPRLILDVEVGNGKKGGLRKLVGAIALHLDIPVPMMNLGRLSLQEGQAAQLKGMFRSLLCME